jgi:uncharacterized membrane protein
MVIVVGATLVATAAIAFTLFDLQALRPEVLRDLFLTLAQGGSLTEQGLENLPVLQVLLLGFLLGVGLGVPLLMAQAFSAAFVVFENLGAWAAMKASFQACSKNIWPFLAYGLGMTGVYLLGALFFGIGLIVAPAIQMASTYYAFTDILGRVPVRHGDPA